MHHKTYEIVANIYISSNRVKQRDVLHEVQGISAVVVIADYPGEKAVLEYKCLGMLRVPLWPVDISLAIGIKFVGKPDNVVH